MSPDQESDRSSQRPQSDRMHPDAAPPYARLVKHPGRVVVQLLEAPADAVPARTVLRRRCLPCPPVTLEAPALVVGSADPAGVEVNVGDRIPVLRRSRVREEEREDVLRELGRVGDRLTESLDYRVGRQVGVGC